MDKFELLCLLEAISNYAYDIHYTAKGRYFFSDHLFSERLSDVDVKDDFIETFYLGKSEEAPASADIARKVATLTPQITDNTQDNFKRLRDLIIRALMTIQKYDGTKGEEDILGAIAHILQRHNGLLYRQLTYTPEEIRNDNSDWREIVGEEDTTQTLENEKWITVHPNKENPDDYRRLKVEDGETSKEAVERKYGKDKAEKKEPEKETEGKKDKLEEDNVHNLSDEILDDKIKELGDKYQSYFKDREESKENDKEIQDLKKQRDEITQAYYKAPFGSPEMVHLGHEMNRIKEELRQKEYSFEDNYDKEHKTERDKVIKELSKFQQEKYERENQKELVSLRKHDEFIKKIDDFMKNTDNMSDDEYDKKYEEIRDAVKNSDMLDNHKESVLNALKIRTNTKRFDRKVKNIPEKLKSYDKMTDKLVDAFNKQELPSEKAEREENELKKQILDLSEKYKNAQTKEEKDKIALEQTDVIIKKIEYERNKNKIKEDNARAVTEILKSTYGDTGKNIEVAKTSRGSVGEVQYKIIANALNGVIGKNINVSNPPKIRGISGRASFNEVGSVIKLESSDSAGTAIHEYTHFLEANNPKILENCQAFLEYRTKGEKPEKLKVLTGLDYKSWEITKPDKFFNAYCGKIYSKTGEYKDAQFTELMSMGVQRLFENPKEFAAEDREYFNFVVANLRGDI